MLPADAVPLPVGSVVEGTPVASFFLLHVCYHDYLTFCEVRNSWTDIFAAVQGSGTCMVSGFRLEVWEVDTRCS